VPELPEVETVLRGLQQKLGNTPICGLSCHYTGTVIYDKDLLPPVFPDYVTNYARRGKYLILTLSRGNALIIHLRMTGKLIYAFNKPEADKHIRASFTLDNGCSLLFNDIRTFGKIVVCPEDKVQSYLPELGVEPLSEAFAPEYLKDAFAGKLTPVKNALLDQTIVAGLGNIYVCEILYRAKINPVTPAKDMAAKQLTQLVEHTRAVLQEAIDHNGTSISDFRRIDDKTGEFQHFLRVYQKETCPLGHAVKRIKQAGRSTFYCPVCQR